MIANERQGEMSALEDAGRLPGAAYKGATMYTTLSPCDMCTGACIMYGVKRVVLGENENHQGGESTLKERGIEVVNLKDEDCTKMMAKYIKENPKDWCVRTWICFCSANSVLTCYTGMKTSDDRLLEPSATWSFMLLSTDQGREVCSHSQPQR